jgi:hypothetical protein
MVLHKERAEARGGEKLNLGWYAPRENLPPLSDPELVNLVRVYHVSI